LPVKAPISTFRYGGKIKGKTFNIVQAKDLLVLRSVSPLDALRQVLSANASKFFENLSLAFSFPEVKVNVFKVYEPDQLDACRLAFKEDPNIKFAGRVWKEELSGSTFIYTENLFVKFRANLPISAILILLRSYKLSIKEKFTFTTNAYFVKSEGFTGINIFDIARVLGENAQVLICYPEMVFPKKTHQINEKQWFLKEVSIDGYNKPRGVEMRKVWQYSKGENVTIAIIDDGVDTIHPEFTLPGKLVYPRDTILDIDSAQPQTMDENHGTCCAGVALAQGSGLASGVAPMARLIPIRSGGLGSFSEAKAFAWAADHGADIISCSWGPPDGIWYDPNDPAHRIPFPLPDSSSLAIDYALKKGRNGAGCLLVWAAGNGNEEIHYDGYASLPTILAVAACDYKEKRSPYSDFGQNIACCFPSSSASSTPLGVSDGIWTTDRSLSLGYNPEGDYVGTFGGTSASCPGVAGCLALILSVFPKLENRHIRPILNMTSDKISSDTGKYTNGHSHYFGYGRINPYLAILFIKQNLVIDTEFKRNNNSQIEGIRCIFQQNIFQLNLSYYFKNTKNRCLAGQWLLFEEDAFSVDQMVFELDGLDAPLFIIKRYDREDGQFVKLKLVWK